ncbi:MAG: hypothetical protein DWQ06_15785 [Calditrichaeota bacterium]|nr:MAG: hypothetical protein DWQ06_15785 [Calditrichota bacterium]
MGTKIFVPYGFGIGTMNFVPYKFYIWNRDFVPYGICSLQNGLCSIQNFLFCHTLQTNLLNK